MKLFFSCMTHEGKIRGHNEDNYYANGVFKEDEHENRSMVNGMCEEPFAAFGVCDGVGGGANGEAASLSAAMTISEMLPGICFDDEDELEWSCGEMVKSLNRVVCYVRKVSSSERMGTTLAMVIIKDGKAVSCNVGDSRCYLFRDGRLRQLSVDHSQAQQLIDMGVLNEEQARKSDGWHVITQYLGIPEKEFILSPHVSEMVDVMKGDVFLICSDGLSDMVINEDIENIIADNIPEVSGDVTEAISGALLSRALDNGGYDNVTVQVIQVD